MKTPISNTESVAQTFGRVGPSPTVGLSMSLEPELEVSPQV